MLLPNGLKPVIGNHLLKLNGKRIFTVHVFGVVGFSGPATGGIGLVVTGGCPGNLTGSSPTGGTGLVVTGGCTGGFGLGVVTGGTGLVVTGGFGLGVVTGGTGLVVTGGLGLGVVTGGIGLVVTGGLGVGSPAVTTVGINLDISADTLLAPSAAFAFEDPVVTVLL